MKATLYLTIALLILNLSCVKRAKYPSDIPEWLKKKIKSCNLIVKNCHRVVIYEHEKTSTHEIIYIFDPKSTDQVAYTYNYEGKLICALPANGPQCFSSTLIRTIWSEGYTVFQ